MFLKKKRLERSYTYGLTAYENEISLCSCTLYGIFYRFISLRAYSIIGSVYGFTVNSNQK